MKEKKIKTVHITNYYHKNSGGISTAYNKLLEAAERHQRYVRLIVPGGRTEVEETGEFGKIYYVKANYSRLFDKRYRVMMPLNSYILDQSPIKQILRNERPEIIEIGEKYTLSLMAGLMRKGIMNVSETRPMLVHFSCERMDDNIAAFVSDGRIANRVAKGFIRNYVFPMFDFHLANSDYTASELFQSVGGNGIKRSNLLLNFCWRLFRTPKSHIGERILVNQCGVDTVAFSADRNSAEARRRICIEIGVPESAKLLLYAGRLSPEKNVSLLPEIMEHLSADGETDFRLIVAGAGPSSEKLAAEFERAVPGKVKMLGHLNGADKIADLMANCDCFVHPNPREPFGITPLEAMASGLPVVAPNSGGILSYANDDNAWLAEPNAASFAATITQVLADGRREEKVQRALETSSRFTWERSTASLFELYDEMYAEFCSRREIYEYKAAPQEFNFAKESIRNA